MGFERIRLYHYRNLDDAEVMVDAPEVFLIGENGQGKTNFLETVYLLCFGSSFRTRRDAELIRQGEKETGLDGTFRRSGEDQSPVRVSFRFSGNDKRILVDGKRVPDRKELIERLPCIVFCHEDIEFVSGAPERRRWFFNQTMSLNTPLFVDTLRNYRRIVRMRNTALKQEQLDLLPVYDEQAAAAGMEIQGRRSETVRRFNESFSELFRHVSGLPDAVHIRYAPSWKQCETIPEAISRLEQKRSRDLIMQTTTTGPHRDRFVFMYRGKNFSRTASTGQLRLLSLVLRVAQAVHFSSVSSTLPLLLLDDVLLELDPEKRRRFIEVLPAYEQAFFTFLPDERYDRYAGDATMVYHVSDGVLTAGEIEGGEIS